MQELLTRSQAAEEAENQASNPSPNPTMGEIIAARYSRRDLLRGALAVTAISATVAPLALAVAEQGPCRYQHADLQLQGGIGGLGRQACTWRRATMPMS